MWHKISRTAGVQSSFQLYQLAYHSVLFFRLHARGWQRPACFVWRLGHSLKKSGQLIGRNDYAGLRAHWQGVYAGWNAPLTQCGIF